MIILNKIFYFNAAHQYGNPTMSDAENQAAFGKDLRIHGHNYELTVSITGEVNPDTGFIADLGHVKDIVRNHVLEIVDHSLIDKDIPWFRDKQPSTENMVVWIWGAIEQHLHSGKLYRIRLKETPTIYTDYYGPSVK
jgi:6-pyruvoyltetrahydropterin/6-carboxytetrahydropterin synthase